MQSPEIICLLAGAAAALFIVWSDFRRRELRLIPLVLLLAAGIGFRAFRHSPQLAQDLGINAAVTTGILLLVALFLRVLGSKGLVNKRLGLGDVILIYAMGTWFPPAGFVLYLSTGLLFSLACVLVLMVMNRYPRNLPLPLAGLLAVYGLIFMPIYLGFEAEILLAFEAG
jgi:hypothetical protein